MGNLVNLFGRASPFRPVPPKRARLSGARHTSVWMGVSRQAEDTQTLVRPSSTLDLLVGTALVASVGPCPQGHPEDRHEYLMRIGFLRLFRTRPKVTPFLISTQPGGDAPSICALSARMVSVDGFTLVFCPQPGTPRLQVEFGWVATGVTLPGRGMGHSAEVLPPRTVCLELIDERTPR